MKSGTVISIIILAVAVIVLFIVAKPNISDFFEKKEKVSGQWRYKMTVTVETPDGDVSGSAVHEMRNSSRRIDWPDQGNPAKVRGEAVVIDMGARGVLFALISDKADNRFYDVFPLPGRTTGAGGSSNEGIKYHSSLPVGTKGQVDPNQWPGYPKLVTFTNMNDPTSVTLAQVWERKEQGFFYLKEDRMEELFGDGVKLESITIEITDEPVTWGVVDGYLLWLQKIGGGYLHGGFTARGAPLSLHGGNFKQGNPQ